MSLDLIILLFVSEALFCGFDCLFLHLSLRFFVDYLMKCFYIARHLAAKIGNNSGVLI